MLTYNMAMCEKYRTSHLIEIKKGKIAQNLQRNESTNYTVRNAQFRTISRNYASSINLLKPTGHVMHQQFNIQQLYALPTLYLCVLYLSENKQRLVPLTA